MRGLLEAELSAEVVRFGALDDGPVMVGSRPLFGDLKEYP
jgi:hypothetical protein